MSSLGSTPWWPGEGVSGRTAPRGSRRSSGRDRAPNEGLPERVVEIKLARGTTERQRGWNVFELAGRNLSRYPTMPLRPTWSRSQMQAILRNPKYTGYNVWGRHDKRRGRPALRPREGWVWSPAPTHAPLVPKELFELVDERARGTPSGPSALRSATDTGRTDGPAGRPRSRRT
jgi:hypothetical protein